MPPRKRPVEKKIKALPDHFITNQQLLDDPPVIFPLSGMFEVAEGLHAEMTKYVEWLRSQRRLCFDISEQHNIPLPEAKRSALNHLNGYMVPDVKLEPINEEMKMEDDDVPQIKRETLTKHDDTNELFSPIKPESKHSEKRSAGRRHKNNNFDLLASGDDTDDEAPTIKQEKISEKNDEDSSEPMLMGRSLLRHSEIKPKPTSLSPPRPQRKQPKRQTPAPKKLESYNIDDLDSDDSTDTEYNPRKPIPNWADRRVLEKTATAQYQNRDVDYKDIFGTMENPHTLPIFDPAQLRRRRPRGSSADWNSPDSNPTKGKSQFLGY